MWMLNWRRFRRQPFASQLETHSWFNAAEQASKLGIRPRGPTGPDECTESIGSTGTGDLARPIPPEHRH
jgi:hypothetical protein